MGGGYIIAPLMLHLGIHPSVSTATSNTILFFSTSFAALSYQRMGLLNYQVRGHLPASSAQVALAADGLRCPFAASHHASAARLCFCVPPHAA